MTTAEWITLRELREQHVGLSTEQMSELALAGAFGEVRLVPGGRTKLIHLETDRSRGDLHHVYLEGARNLRDDLPA